MSAEIAANDAKRRFEAMGIPVDVRIETTLHVTTTAEAYEKRQGIYLVEASLMDCHPDVRFTFNVLREAYGHPDPPSPEPHASDPAKGEA